MADLIIPDSRMEMPSLYQPGRKPVGKVKIDWSHPLSRGLSLCLIFQQDAAVNLVSGKVARQINGAKWTPDGMYFDGSNDYLLIGNHTINSKYSILFNVKYDHNSGLGKQSIFSFGLQNDNNSINISLLEDASGSYPHQLLAQSHSSSWAEDILSSKLYPEIDELNIALTVNARDGILYIDGVSDATNAGFGASAMTDGTYDTVYLGIPSALQYYLGGAIRYTYVYDRVLSPAEVLSMNESPYQFLIPA